MDGFVDDIEITINSLFNPDDNKPGGGFNIYTYADSGQIYAVDKLIGEDILVPMLECDYPCATCS